MFWLGCIKSTRNSNKKIDLQHVRIKKKVWLVYHTNSLVTGPGLLNHLASLPRQVVQALLAAHSLRHPGVLSPALVGVRFWFPVWRLSVHSKNPHFHSDQYMSSLAILDLDCKIRCREHHIVSPCWFGTQEVALTMEIRNLDSLRQVVSINIITFLCEQYHTYLPVTRILIQDFRHIHQTLQTPLQYFQTSILQSHKSNHFFMTQHKKCQVWRLA